ncbi:MAG: hypothetical protein IJW02_07510 [Clostridia bacterium]|nr:hypothetical protein [Clostridia bacterium]
MNVGAIITAAVIGALTVADIVSIVKCLIEKKYLAALHGALMIPFMLFFVSSVILGGSAFNDAAKDYESYREGAYYLVNHGDYTEVTRVQHQYMKCIQIIGFAGFALDIILIILTFFYEKKTSKTK